jgi:FAD/FMN-containing dehydrogenase
MPVSGPTAPADINDLRAALHGRAITPEDAEYDATRALFYGGVDGRPSLIVRVANADDISRSIEFARESELELAIRSGGHSVAGHSTTDGGIVIDLHDMRAFVIDPDAGVASAEPGLTAGEFTTAAGAHGLGIGFGDTGSVGLGGLTLGGGVGYLVRKHGLTIDSLLAADIVTADGELLHVDADSHPDLFWAIRGGGGNFGVATSFRFQLHPVASFVGGLLVLPATGETISGFVAEAEAAPEELSAIANVMNCPPLPFVPEAVHGSVVVLATMAYVGPAAEGERVLAPFRALAKPIADQVKPMPYPEIYPPEDPEYHPTAAAYTMLMDTIDSSLAQRIVDRLEAFDASLRAAQIRVLGGAMARVPVDATAFAHRKSRIMVNVAAFYDGPDDMPIKQAWVDQLAADLKQSDDGAYVNFLTDEGEQRVRAAYPGETWTWLAAIKARYDPTNLFRRNQNIPPASSPTSGR